MKNLTGRKSHYEQDNTRAVEFLISASQYQASCNNQATLEDNYGRTKSLLEDSHNTISRTLELQALLLQQKKRHREMLDKQSLEHEQLFKIHIQINSLQEANRQLKQKLNQATSELNTLWKQHTALQRRSMKASRGRLDKQLTNINQARARIRDLTGKPISVAAFFLSDY